MQWGPGSRFSVTQRDFIQQDNALVNHVHASVHSWKTTPNTGKMYMIMSVSFTVLCFGTNNEKEVQTRTDRQKCR